MKVYRGPQSKPFTDDSHEYVSQIKPNELEEGIKSNALIQFNITKDGYERQAVCTALFEDDDYIPMINGLLSRLNKQQECLSAIKVVMDEGLIANDEKISLIRKALLRLNS